MKNIPHYDLHVVQRDKNILDYTSRGARDVIKIQTAYEPTLHYPPPPGWSDADRDRQVSFIGTPYDDRAQTLGRLWRECGFFVAVSGSAKLWSRAMQPDVFRATFRDGELYRDDYRSAIWRSRINLSFLTHSNQDEFVHKSFEIAGCGGFLLAERSPGHSQRFKEDEEAVFFSTFDELAESSLPPDEAARQHRRRRKHRAARDGYHNDRQVGTHHQRISPSCRLATQPLLCESSSRESSVTRDPHRHPPRLHRRYLHRRCWRRRPSPPSPPARAKVLLLEAASSPRRLLPGTLRSEIAGLPHRGIHTGRIASKATIVRWEARSSN
jgi:hypothetical protein